MQTNSLLLSTALRRLAATLAWTVGAFAAVPATAQMKVEITGVGASQFPIAVAGFPGESSSVAQSISAIVRADLDRSRVFKMIDHAGQALPESAAVNYGDWKTRGADALAVGSVQRMADGRYDVRYRLFDTVKQTEIDNQAISGTEGELRLVAHKIADRIYEKLTGDKGVFATRIAYVQKQGAVHELIVADSDGQNRQIAMRSREPIISPKWSPDGGKIAYVSFESKKPVVYVHSISNGQRVPVANFKGNNSAPAWSPDGRTLAVVLSRDGTAQIYAMNADGSGLKRLTNSNAIDTEPVFSGDGASIYFTSDRGGGPQIYRMSSSGGDATRVTFKGEYNISPRVSADGKTLVYVTRRGGKFQIAALDLASGNELLLTETGREESPAIAPNGKVVLYSTHERGRGILAAKSIDGRTGYTLSEASGEIREPTWGPFLR
jgi:TolB protein